jgi:hypothetical protein
MLGRRWDFGGRELYCTRDGDVIDTIDFGGLVLDSFSDRSITVQNTGIADLTIGPITQPSTPFAIVADNCSNNTLSPSKTYAMMIRFSPTEQNSFSSSFNVSSNGWR